MKINNLKPEEVEKPRMNRFKVCGECGYEIRNSEFGVYCDCCKACFHGLCVYIEEHELFNIDVYHCLKCEERVGPSSSKQKTNVHRRDMFEMDAESKPMQSGTPAFLDGLLRATLCDGEEIVEKVKGQKLTMLYLLKRGFNRPIVVGCIEGLDMQLPDETFDERRVMTELGADHMLDVFNVRLQKTVRMKMVSFVRMMQKTPSQRKTNEIYDCHSLEISQTSIAAMVKVPRVVNNICWISSSWPQSETKPDLLKYCIISMENSFVDFHIDFGGSSIWYHVFKGQKVFYLIEPTEKNLELYEDWVQSPNQSDTLFYSLVEKCYKLRLYQGETLFIPGGWIHAVYSSCDSIAFAGNFFHSFSIPIQLKVSELDRKLKRVTSFPFIELLHWYAAPTLIKFMQDNIKKIPSEEFVTHVVQLIKALKNWLHKSKKNNKTNALLAPNGVNCPKIISDLTALCKRAKRILNGAEVCEKPGRKRKSDQLEVHFLNSINKRSKHRQEDHSLSSEVCPKTEEGTEELNNDKNEEMNGDNGEVNDSDEKPTISETVIDSVAKPVSRIKIRFMADNGVEVINTIIINAS